MIDLGPPPLVFPKPAIVRPATSELVRYGNPALAHILAPVAAWPADGAGVVSFVTAPAHHADQTVESSESFSVDASTGANRGLLVFAFHELDVDQAISAMTYDGVALSKILDNPGTGSTSTTERHEIWFLADPASGINTLAASYDNTNQDAVLQPIILQGTGPLSIAPVGGANEDSAEDTASMSLTLSINGGSMIVVGCTVETESTGPFTPDTDTVERVDDAVDSGNFGFGFFIGTRSESSAGSYSVGAESTGLAEGPRDFVISAVEVRSA